MVQREENRQNQHAGLADTDQPDEIDDRKTPADRDVNAPDSYALDDEPSDGDGHQAHQAEGNPKAYKPAEASRARNYNGADLVCDRGVGKAWRKHRRRAANFGRIQWRPLPPG